MSSFPPIDETPAETARSSGFPRHWIILGLLVLAHAVIGAYFIPGYSWLFVIAVGAAISQPILLATWAVFARQRFCHRLSWSLLTCTYLSLAYDLGMAQHVLDGGELILNSLALFVISVVILLPIRFFSRWRMAHLDSKDTASVYQDHQVGVNNLLILTAAIAVTCGVVRSLFVITHIDRSYFPYNCPGEFIVIVGTLLVVVLPSYTVPWITLADHRKGYRTFCLAVLLAIFIELADLYIVMKLRYFPRNFSCGIVYWSMDDCFFWVQRGTMGSIWMQFGTTLSAIITTLALRFCGFRMIREPKAQA
jgi:hypothetical protein